jgi:hypothetical protein
MMADHLARISHYSPGVAAVEGRSSHLGMTEDALERQKELPARILDRP